MEELKLNDGRSIPLLAYGAGTAMIRRQNEGEIDRARVETFKKAIQSGFYHLDTAQMYQTEMELGIAIKESGVPRGKLFVTTKVSSNYLEVSKAIDTSLEKLGLDYVDLYLIHEPYWAASDTDLQTAWAGMEAIKASGKARSIGVSNFRENHIQTLLETAKVPPSVNQIEFQPYLQHHSLLAFQQKHGIITEAYGVLAPLTRNVPSTLDESLTALSDKYSEKPEVICLRWCMDQGVVAVTTTRNEARMADYMRGCNLKLAAEDMQAISDQGLKYEESGAYEARIQRYIRRMKEKEG